ncbi:CRP/FNR family transcriptional regulator, anaerobic regulatory protein [Rhodovulum sp. ES.010]|uniref:Crp/Fnr family transcriptional regulator n=1 Tax=Rhodovulum sp. ES.010 TaxID=1882821 RepID=UPI00092ABECF|nr:Crp/Fnr family transcriptional regulator [Rhodovulum sp. ES.010]SIO22825.1 CRP/FNR family transcriptional regulator, anaerobic regulatory protein [Rhodovulum sp. ES.010]
MTHVQEIAPKDTALPCGLGGGVCAELSAQAVDALAASARLERVSAGRVLWRDDGPPGMVGLLVSGYLRLQRFSREGRRQILNLSVPGDLFGHEAERRAEYTLEAATDATLCRFDRRTFERLAREDHSLRRALYRHNSRNLDRLRWLTWTIAALRPEERIAGFLLNATAFMPVQRLPDGTALLTLAIGRRDMADLLATSVETICRVLKGLERDGLIRLIDSNHLHLRDETALALRAGQTAPGAAMTLVNTPTLPGLPN